MNKIKSLECKQLLELVNKNKTDLYQLNNKLKTYSDKYNYIINNLDIEINKINKSELFLSQLYEYINNMFNVNEMYSKDNISFIKEQKIYITRNTLISKLNKNSNVLLANIPFYLLNKELILNNNIDLFYDIESEPLIYSIDYSLHKAINIINIIGYYFLTNANIYLTNNLSYLLHKNLDLDDDLIIPNNKMYDYIMLNADKNIVNNLNDVLYSGDNEIEKIIDLCKYELGNNGFSNIIIKYKIESSKLFVYDEDNDEYNIDFTYIQELNNKMDKYKIKIVSVKIINDKYLSLLILNTNY